MILSTIVKQGNKVIFSSNASYEYRDDAKEYIRKLYNTVNTFEFNIIKACSELLQIQNKMTSVITTFKCI